MTGKLPLTWAKDKADKLAALQTALDTMLKNGDAICIIPESDRQSGGGTPAGGSGDSAAYNLSNGFTMKPEYSRYYLLPALRAMAETGSGMESSNWYYYVGDYMNNPAAMQLPAIQLDAPDAGLTAVGWIIRSICTPVMPTRALPAKLTK